MKKTFIILGVALLTVAGLLFAQATTTLPYLDYLGLHIGAKVTDKVGFYGATPVVRQTITNTAPAAVALTLSTFTITNAHADVTNVVTVVTNVTVNTVYGYTTSNQLNAVRNSLVNLGLASTTGN